MFVEQGVASKNQPASAGAAGGAGRRVKDGMNFELQTFNVQRRTSNKGRTVMAERSSRQQLALPWKQLLFVLIPAGGQRDEQRAAGDERGVQAQFRRPLIAAVFKGVETALL